MGVFLMKWKIWELCWLKVFIDFNPWYFSDISQVFYINNQLQFFQFFE
jgi:hypothetical protein